MGKRWSFTDTDCGARTIEENVELSQKSRKTYNVSHRPLFSSIPLSNVIIDNLHLFVRVADVLIGRLIDELKRQDAIEKACKFANFDVTNHCHLQGYEAFVWSLGIPSYTFYVGKDSKALKICTLTGPEKLKLFDKISIRELLPTLDAFAQPTGKAQPD